MLTTKQIDDIIAGKKRYVEPEQKEHIGKGKKKCSSCGEIVAARLRKCQCGYEFGSTEPVKEKTVEELKENSYIRGLGLKGRVIYTPSIPCPVPLSSFDEDSVILWCENVVDEGNGDRYIYCPSCLIYWLREFLDVNSSEYERVKQIVVDWSDSIINANFKL